MAYTPLTDFLALLRQTGNGVRTERMPGLDYILVALERAGMFATWVGSTEPTADKPTTVWVRPNANGSWTAEADVFLWNEITQEYEVATPALWAALFALLGSLTVTVAQLPPAGTVGRRLFVSDANSAVFNAIVAGGGANKVPVFDSGDHWRIG